MKNVTFLKEKDTVKREFFIGNEYREIEGNLSFQEGVLSEFITKILEVVVPQDFFIYDEIKNISGGELSKVESQYSENIELANQEKILLLIEGSINEEDQKKKKQDKSEENRIESDHFQLKITTRFKESNIQGEMFFAIFRTILGESETFQIPENYNLKNLLQSFPINPERIILNISEFQPKTSFFGKAPLEVTSLTIQCHQNGGKVSIRYNTQIETKIDILNLMKIVY